MNYWDNKTKQNCDNTNLISYAKGNLYYFIFLSFMVKLDPSLKNYILLTVSPPSTPPSTHHVLSLKDPLPLFLSIEV